MMKTLDFFAPLGDMPHYVTHLVFPKNSPETIETRTVWLKAFH